MPVSASTLRARIASSCVRTCSVYTSSRPESSARRSAPAASNATATNTASTAAKPARRSGGVWNIAAGPFHPELRAHARISLRTRQAPFSRVSQCLRRSGGRRCSNRGARLRGGRRSEAARTVPCPRERVDAELPHLHVGIPCVVHHVLRRAVGRDGKRVVSRPAHLSGHAAQHAGLASLAHVRSHDVICHHVVDPVRCSLVIGAAVEAVIASVVTADERPLDGVPLVERPVVNVHPAPGLVECPGMARAHDGATSARQLRHVHEPVHDDGSPREHAAFRVQEVARIEHVPLPVRVPERVGVDREPVTLAIDERGAVIRVRSVRRAARRYPQRERLFLLAAHGVIEEERAVLVRDFRSPVPDTRHPAWAA